MAFDADLVADALIGQGLSTKTVVAYVSVLRRAQDWCEPRGIPLAELTATEARALSNEWPLTRSSRAQLRSALGRYWEASGRLDGPLKAIRVPGHPRMRCRALSEPEAALLASAAEARDDHRGLAVLLGLYVALRRAEIATLRFADVDRAGWLTLTGKGDVTDSIPVHPLVLEALLRHEKRRRRHSPWVFPGRWNGPVNPTTIWLWTREVAADVGIDLTTHVLRHTALATANDATRDLRAVQAFARHARPETTAGYTRTRASALIGVMQAINYQKEATA